MAKNNNEKLSQAKMIKTLYTTLLGVPGTADQGFIGDVKDAIKGLKDSDEKLWKKHNGLSRRVWILIIALASSGIFGANQTGLLGG